MARKKKEEVEEELEEEFDDEPSQEELDRLNEESLKRSLESKAMKRKEVVEVEDDDSIEALRKKLARAEAEEGKKKFFEVAPKKLEELEKVVSQNRNYIIKLNEQIKNINDNFSQLIKAK